MAQGLLLCHACRPGTRPARINFWRRPNGPRRDSTADLGADARAIASSRDYYLLLIGLGRSSRLGSARARAQRRLATVWIVVLVAQGSARKSVMLLNARIGDENYSLPLLLLLSRSPVSENSSRKSLGERCSSTGIITCSASPAYSPREEQTWRPAGRIRTQMTISARSSTRAIPSPLLGWAGLPLP
jgi:hypothetical protein